MLHKIWYPKKSDLTKFRVIFMVSIPVCMILFLVLNILVPSFIWFIINCLWLIIIFLIQIISSIRFQITEAKVVQSQNSKMFGKLSGKDRKQFLKTTFLLMPIITISTIGVLFVLNIIEPLDILFVIIVVIFNVAIYLYSIWSIYNKLAQGKDLL